MGYTWRYPFNLTADSALWGVWPQLGVDQQVKKEQESK